MSTTSPVPLAGKEFRFFSDSHIVTVVFEDDTTIEFQGEDNYRKAHHVVGAHAPSAALELVDQKGETVNMVVNKGVLVEAFNA